MTEADPQPTPEPQPQTERQRRKAAARAYEQSLPEAQQKVNRFCENWIFAFLVAMVIRHFFIEAYRIPTASMEPILYGSHSMLKADHVVVDKFLFRFTGPSRWGVTVFQYPVPEVGNPQSPDFAINSKGERLDSFPFYPLVQRNFVKRAVVMPGDTFYLANGDLFLQGEDGSFSVAEKPEDIQEVLWLPIYEHGRSLDYLPWEGSGGARVEADGPRIDLTLADGGAVSFTQPLRNLYVKPGTVKVRTRRGNRGVNQDPESWIQYDASLLEPEFVYQGRPGNIWNLGAWDVARVTAKDLDSDRHGTLLNDVMDEFVGDVRLRFRLQKLEGTLIVSQEERTIQSLDWEVRVDGWALRVDDREVASGSNVLVGKELTFISVDDRLQVRADGAPLHEPVAVSAADPSAHRSSLRFAGSGTATIVEVRLDRDVHYSKAGLLEDEWDLFWQPPQRGGYFVDEDELRPGAERARVLRRNLAENRRQFIEALADPDTRKRFLASFEARDSRNGKAQRLWLEPLGDSPERALTAPEGAYLLLGDNSPFSLDARAWGWVPRENLRGSVLAVVLPRWVLVK
jgi:signal peptidase I